MVSPTFFVVLTLFLHFCVGTEKLRRTLILHAGPWKTGTTTIQAELKAKRSDLLESSVFIPDFYSGNHHYVVEYFTRSNTDMPHLPVQKICEDLFKKLVADTLQSDAKYVILSAESFAMMHSKEMKALADFFPGFNIKVIAYYRNPIAWVYSMYRQEIRDFPLRTPILFTSYLLQANPLDSPLASYLDIFYKYEAAFGKENLIVVDYDGFLRNGLNIMDSFFSAMNIRVNQRLFSKNTSNSNLGLDSVETIYNQLWRVFDSYLQRMKGCSTYNKENWGKLRLRKKTLVNSTFMGRFSSSMPVKFLHFNMVLAYGLSLDQKLRNNLGNRMIYGDQKKTEELMASYDNFRQLDIDAVLTTERERWTKIFRKQMMELEHDGLSCGGKMLFE